ncbi:GNAT family N-acetyltransferase [Candidatus Micrarchaeota archaeon]|nr:GNAT family N-acetyltransferase [Candidatus Micrarchaeota archaeon]
MDKIKLKDGRVATVEFIGKNDNAGDHMKFINGLIEEKAYILFDRKVTFKEETGWVKTNVEGQKKKERFLLVARVNGKIAGNSSAIRGTMKERNNVSVGIALAKEFRSIGLGEKLLKLNIKYAKKMFRPKNIYLTVFAANKRAHGLYKKAGFREIAVLPKWISHYGKYIDLIVMKL